MIYITKNERLSKESEHQAEISARKSIMTDHQHLSCNINIYHATSTETLQMKTNMMSINIHLQKLIQKSITNMNSWKSSEVIKTTMRRIRNNLTLKRDWKSKLHKTSLQLKQKWMKETLEQMKMNWSHLYTVIFWSELSKIVIVVNKKMSIRQYNLNTFALKQRV